MNKINWTKEMLDRLGTAPDAELAAEWGISAGVVCDKRIDLGISGKGTRGKTRIDWAPIDALLTELPVDELVRRFGVSKTSISLRKQKLGLVTRKSGRPRTWTDAEIEELKNSNPTKFARKHNISPATAWRKANELGIHQGDRVVKHGNERVPDWAIDAMRLFLDSHIADYAGVSRERIRQIRAQKGIQHLSQSEAARNGLEYWMTVNGIERETNGNTNTQG